MYQIRIQDAVARELGHLDKQIAHRVVYEILHTEQVIVVHLIGHRREIYGR